MKTSHFNTTLEALNFSQWRVFSSILKRMNVETPLISAVYYHRRDTLVLPGSNLKVKKLNTPRELSKILIDACPHPEDDTDHWAAAVACRYFLHAAPQDSQSSQILLAQVLWDNQRPVVFSGRSNQSLRRVGNVSLRWPDTFKKFIRSVLRGQEGNFENVAFVACPLILTDHAIAGGTRSGSIEHIGFFYFGISKDGLDSDLQKRIGSWVNCLRDLMIWGVLAYESEKEIVRQVRLDRITVGDETVTKFAPPDETSNLTAQTNYLDRMRKKSNTSSLIFPEVLEVTRTPIPYYKMPRFKIPSLRSLLCGTDHPSPEELTLILRRLLEALFDSIYVPTAKPQTTASSRKWAQKLVGSRLNRLTSIQDALERISKSQPVSLRSAVQLVEESDTHRVTRHLLRPQGQPPSRVRVTDLHRGGRDAKSLSFPWDILNETATFHRLASPTHSEIHGDLHFDNILVDPYFPDEPIFVVIDPRGGTSGDPACDIGKLMFSCEAGYDFVGTGNFDVDVAESSNSEPWVTVDLPSSKVVHRGLGGGASSAGLVSIGRSLPRKAQDLYKQASTLISHDAASLANEKLGDNKLMDRSTFYMGLFCLVTAETHYIQNPDGALALLTRGCQIISQWKENAKKPS